MYLLSFSKFQHEEALFHFTMKIIVRKLILNRQFFVALCLSLPSLCKDIHIKFMLSRTRFFIFVPFQYAVLLVLCTYFSLQVSGSKFYYLKNEAVMLEMGLVNWAVSEVMKRGFTPLTTPEIVRSSVVEKCGFQPRGANTQVISYAANLHLRFVLCQLIAQVYYIFVLRVGSIE